MVSQEPLLFGNPFTLLRVPILIGIALAIAFSGGVWSAMEALRASTGFSTIEVGPWQAWPEAQTAAADPYAKAHRARSGELLFGLAEGLSFTAEVDSFGNDLIGSCDYAITGFTPPARFWTLRLTSEKSEPIRAAANLPGALNSRGILRDEEGAFTILLARSARPGNWLALPDDSDFRVVLTLLDTPTTGSSAVVDVDMPEIRQGECRDN